MKHVVNDTNGYPTRDSQMVSVPSAERRLSGVWSHHGGRSMAGTAGCSKRVVTDAGQATYVELRDLAGKNALELNTDQRSKTAIALEAITSAHQP